MKKVYLIIALALAGVTFATSEYEAGPHSGVSLGMFYSSLDAYGEWIPVSQGMYGWRPLHMAGEWRPYTFGRWIWTDEGWYWASDEPWAWAVYHYGRWYYDDYYGWVWIPGYDWAPAWVEWRIGDGYFGWAPLGPYAVFNVNFGIRYERWWETPNNYWCFADVRYICDPHIDRHVYRHDQNRRFLGRSREGGSVWYDGGHVVTRGPGRDFVERHIGRRLERAEVVTVRDRSEQVIRREGNRERVQVYRPETGGRGEGRELTRPERVRDSGRPLPLDIRRTDAGSRMTGRPADSSPRSADIYRERRIERNSDRSPAPESRTNSDQRLRSQQIPETRIERNIPRNHPAPSIQLPPPEVRSNREAERRSEWRGAPRVPEQRVERNPRAERSTPPYQSSPRVSPRPREQRSVPETRRDERQSRGEDRRRER